MWRLNGKIKLQSISFGARHPVDFMVASTQIQITSKAERNLQSWQGYIVSKAGRTVVLVLM